MNTSAKERKDFTLLITGSRDNDRAAEIAAPPGMEVVHCKFSYVPMYEKFGEIKKLQLKLRDTDYTRGRRVCCAADLSEWVGHENEDLFTVTLKYFHDHRSRFDYIFTVGEHTEDEVRDMYFMLRCYMSGRIVRDAAFLEVRALTDCIRGKGISGEAAELLSEMIMEGGMEQLRAYPVIDIMCGELRSLAKGRRPVSLVQTEQYLRSEDSLPHILSSKTAVEYADKAQLLISGQETMTGLENIA